MSEELKSPDLNSLPLVMVRNSDTQNFAGPFPLVLVLPDRIHCFLVVADGGIVAFSEIKPYTPPTKRTMNHPEIFEAIRNGAVVREAFSESSPTNFWMTNREAGRWKICYKFTDTEADVWESMEVSNE
jgi:hypothetical protein